MQELPEKVVLLFKGDPDNFKVDIVVTTDGRDTKTRLGRAYADEDGDWILDRPDHYSTTSDGPFSVIGNMLDEILDDGDPDDELDDDNEDGDDDEDGDDEPEHEEGRQWTLISKTSDSITRAMEIFGNSEYRSTMSPLGCLVRVETWGDPDGGEYSSSVVFVPSSLEELLQTESK